MKVTLLEKTPRLDEKTLLVTILDEKKEKLVEERRGEATLMIGLGKKEEINLRKLQTLVRKIVQSAKASEYRKVIIMLSHFQFKNDIFESEEELVSFIVQNLYLANFAFTRFKTTGAKKQLQEVVLVGTATKEVKNGVREGRIIGEETNKCRVLANTPGGDMTPLLLAQEAKKAALGASISCKILNQKQLEKEGMEAILGVARGSSEEPYFIILEHLGGETNERPIVLIGKGVTFDTGGLNLKPSDGISDMHLDMSGGGAVIHAIILASRLKLKKNVIALIPAVENMPGGSSYRPGDILKSLSGKTIEVLNTDAEGRVILADALTYAKRYNPRLVIDVATLTGAALVALGQHAHAIMTRDPNLAQNVSRLGEISGEYVWPLPLWDEYEQYTPGTFGDVANLAVGSNSRYGGAINGGMFLYQFAKEYPKDTSWMHIDMAPRMVSAPGDNLEKGATGEPVRLLYRILKEL